MSAPRWRRAQVAACGRTGHPRSGPRQLLTLPYCLVPAQNCPSGCRVVPRQGSRVPRRGWGTQGRGGGKEGAQGRVGRGQAHVQPG